MKRNTEKITRNFCQGKTLIFYPVTEEEAEFIQRKLFAMGFSWESDALINGIGHGGSCVKYGMKLEEGKLATYPQPKDKKAGFLCTSDQFDEKFKTDQELLMEQFNKLSAGQKEISKKLDELIKRVDAVYEEIKPKRLDKQVIGRSYEKK